MCVRIHSIDFYNRIKLYKIFAVDANNSKLYNVREKSEERIDKRNDYGIKDLTAYNAVLQIKTNGKANIVLR